MTTRADLEKEIRLARNPDKQMQIIAELNDVSVKRLKRYLAGEVDELVPPVKIPGGKASTWHSWSDEELLKLAKLRAGGMKASSIAKNTVGRSARSICCCAKQTGDSVLTAAHTEVQMRMRLRLKCADGSMIRCHEVA